VGADVGQIGDLPAALRAVRIAAAETLDVIRAGVFIDGHPIIEAR